jgi:predicted RNA-binding protein YlxR (DUF448 family)
VSDPTRTCLGCRAKAAQGDLVRVYRVDDGLALGKGPGRGAYFHTACWQRALPRLPRALRAQVDTSELASLLGEGLGKTSAEQFKT